MSALPLDRRHALRLGALFSALLAGCTDRPLSEESESGGMTGGETGSTAAPTTDAPATTSGTSATSGTDTGTSSSSTTSTSNTSITSDEPPVCVYADHLITLTPEEYAYWVEHGAPPPGDTTGGDTTGGDATTADTDVPTTGAASTSGAATGAPSDTDTDGATTVTDPLEPGGCGCRSGHAPSALSLIALLALTRRRRRAAR